jgi:hypothetical protein
MTTDKKAFAPSMVILTEEPRVLRPPDLSLAGILGRFPGLAKVPALGITGSTAAGWGNPYSDIDIYAFTDGECELPEDDSVESWRSTDPRGLNRINWIGRYDDALVDLKVWPLDAPRRALADFLDGNDPELIEISYMLQDLIYRLSISQPLIGDDFFAQTRSLIATSTYPAALARQLKVNTENRLNDVAGQLQAGDGLGARMSAMSAAGFVTDCCLVLAGNLCRSEKWLLRRLERTPACGITVSEYCSVVLDGPHPGESFTDCARRIANWVRATNIKIESAVLG